MGRQAEQQRQNGILVRLQTASDAGRRRSPSGCDILTPASPHDSQVAIPLMQMTDKRAKVLYDLADSAYDAPEIYKFSKALGRVPIIGPNKRRGDEIELEPAKKIRYRERSTVERGTSGPKDIGRSFAI